MKSNFDADLQQMSATETAPASADAHIRELTAALAVDVPADFTKNVMDAIRAERRKIAFRHRMVRLGSAIAAAIVIVPMAAIVLPAMIRSEKNADIALTDNDPALYAPGDTAAGDVLYSTIGETNPATEAPATEEVPTACPSSAPADMPEAEAPAKTESTAAKAPATTVGAPDHMDKSQENPVEPPATADTFAAETKYKINAVAESSVITVLRTIIGADKMDAWLADQTVSEDTPRNLIHAFGIRREVFLTAAADLNLTFTQDELDALFDTPLTEK